MHQKLIVEGADGWALAEICRLNGLPQPAGIGANETGKFIQSAGGFSKIGGLLRATLKAPSFAEKGRIGLVVDANEAGAAARWQSIRSELAAVFSPAALRAAQIGPQGAVIREAEKPTVGVFVMPDNAANGYLEHFLARLAPTESELWQFTEAKIEELSNRDFCRFGANRRQKALLHTWLAWQSEPGRPFGTALQMEYLDAKAAAAEPFLAWMRDVFEF